MNGIHNVLTKQKMMLQQVVVNNGINAEVKTGKAEHVAKKEIVKDKMNGTRNVWIVKIHYHQILNVAVAVDTYMTSAVVKIGREENVVNKDIVLKKMITFPNV